GQLHLDAPAADVVPALAQAHVLAGFDASGTPKLRAPKRAMTLKHLLTHTAGFSYEILRACKNITSQFDEHTQVARELYGRG
ncbi:MAG TPA: serine hydrolase, partial [Candidatus Tectomicrobia bacterium]